MGSALCRPLINGSRVPVCSLCEKVGTGPWRSLSPKDRRLWLVQDGQFFCAKCLISHRIDRLQRDKAEEYSRSLTAAVAARHARGPRSWTPLKKVLSGKAWHKTPSFKAAYVPSARVDELISRVERRGARRSLDAKMPPSIDEPMKEGLDDAARALKRCVRGALEGEGDAEMDAKGEDLAAFGSGRGARGGEGEPGPCRESEGSPGQASLEDLDAVEVESVELSAGSWSSCASPRGQAAEQRVATGLAMAIEDGRI
ncbi:unnamed protein product [Ostreobium quekettii]|uniref:Uncharacterized protein n=1 Tax=Ostreobium quekettii TaxID=121088 RepID=A0A8S1IWN7_9CHLO|nr:unnamed protein product [Ostreobium quekettii]